MNVAKTVKTTLYSLTLPSEATTSIKGFPQPDRPNAIWLDYTILKDASELRTFAKMLEDVADDMEGKKIENQPQFFPALGGTLYDNLADSANIN